MSNKVMGKNVLILAKPDGDLAFADVGGDSRGFSYEDKGEEIDVTVRASEARESEDDFPDVSGKFDGLVVKPSEDGTPALTLMPRGSTGELEVREEGTGTGKPKITMTYKVLGISKDYPYDDAVSWEMDLRLGVPVEATQV